MTQHDDGSGHEKRIHGEAYSVPAVTSAVAYRARNEDRRRFFEGGREFTDDEVIVIDVETDAEYPIAGTGLALFIGGVPIVDSERTGKRQYRFFAPGSLEIDEEGLVALGRAGSGMPRPERKSRVRLAWHDVR